MSLSLEHAIETGTRKIPISEIFGPVIQGEGALIGKPTIFVRVGGCDYRCSWCDTMYAVDTKHRAEWKQTTNADIIGQIRALSPFPILITLSGGNPALYDFGPIIDALHELSYPVAIETQGSVARRWFSKLDILTLSPKPPSSGMPTDYNKLDDCVAALCTATNFKIVVADDADYEYAKVIALRYPKFPIYLSVCNLAPSTVGDVSTALLWRLRWLCEKVIDDGWWDVTVLPQLHVLLYGSGKRGV